MDLTALTLTQLRDALRAGETTSVAATEAIIDRIVRLDNSVGSYLTLADEMALGQAAAADRRREEGDDEPLLGIPVAVKDLICTAGVETRAGSKILDGFVPPYDAYVVERLKTAGAVILGQTNADEFAMGSSTENSAYLNTRNPWDLDRVPGGSSGGSAAAVAAGMAYAALGTDTGGSVRQPAALCGIVGIRPTYGRVSRRGVIAYASSLDQVGAFGRTVADCAMLLHGVAGHDPLDSTSIDAPVPDYEAALTGEIDGLRIGVPTEFFGEGIDAEVAAAVEAAIACLEKLGARIQKISLPHAPYALPAYYLIAPAEASANLARYDGIRFGPLLDGEDVIASLKKTRALFGDEVKRRIMMGTYVLSAGYYEAYYGRALEGAHPDPAGLPQRRLQQVDVIAAPTSPTTAFPPGRTCRGPADDVPVGRAYGAGELERRLCALGSLRL
jgi:aspartyl-tRNA(Asn)/glutamyl-tRNA(Gln) amidotransferase subunit A